MSEGGSRLQEIVLAKPELSKWLGVGGEATAYDGITPGMQFDFVKMSPYDHTMHCEEALIKREAHDLLAYLFKSERHALTLQVFNQALREYRWSAMDMHNRPQTQSAGAFTIDGHLFWSSAEAVVFAQNSLTLLQPYVESVDARWVCWERHVRYLRTMNQRSFTMADVARLNEEIISHHELHAQVWSGRELPKGHWIMHAPMDILTCGPLWMLAVLWRMEGKHRMFKQWSDHLNQHSQLQTLAKHHSRRVTLDQYLAKHDPHSMPTTIRGQ